MTSAGATTHIAAALSATAVVVALAVFDGAEVQPQLDEPKAGLSAVAAVAAVTAPGRAVAGAAAGRRAMDGTRPPPRRTT